MTTKGLWRGGGELLIAPGVLVATPGKLTASLSSARATTHNSMRVDVFAARLVPPWFNVTIPVHGDAGMLVASMSIFARRRIQQTLQSAGFEVHEHVTWTYRGFRWSDMG